MPRPTRSARRRSPRPRRRRASRSRSSGAACRTRPRSASPHDGRVFVAEKSGLIKVFDNVDDPTPTIYADLRTNVHYFWDRGLLGIALDPQFTTGRPYVYVLYTYDARIGQQPPDAGATPARPRPGATGDGCVVSGRLSRLNGPGRAGPDRGLVPAVPEPLESARSPSAPTARSTSAPATARASTSPTTARTATRSTRAATRPAASANPDAADRRGRRAAQPGPPHDGGPDGPRRHDPPRRPRHGRRACRTTRTPAAPTPNARRIVAYGLRNPFRFTFRPGHERALGRRRRLERPGRRSTASPSPAAPVENFGWPCYEGDGPACRYDASTSTSARRLYARGPARRRAALHLQPRARRSSHGDAARPASSSITGLAFYDGGTFPAAYDGALFFADYSRNCIWVMFPGAERPPRPGHARGLHQRRGRPGRPAGRPRRRPLLRRPERRHHPPRPLRSRQPAPRSPTRRRTPTSGAAPLTVQFDGTRLERPRRGRARPTRGTSTATARSTTRPPRRRRSPTRPRGRTPSRLRVDRPGGLVDTDTVTVTAGTPPDADDRRRPTRGTTWRVGETIGFSGSATNAPGRVAARLRPVVDARPPPLLGARPDELPRSTRCRRSPAPPARFVAPDHEYPVPPRARAHGARRDAQRDDVSGGSTRRPSSSRSSRPRPGSRSPSARRRRPRRSRGRSSRARRVGVIAPSPADAGGKTYDVRVAGPTAAPRATRSPRRHAGRPTARPTPRALSAVDGLVGAWGFDEPNGTDADRRLGPRQHRHDQRRDARPRAGASAPRCRFDGVNDIVTVADSDSLDLSNRATLEAWVNPAALGDWRTVAAQGAARPLVYALYAQQRRRPAQRPRLHEQRPVHERHAPLPRQHVDASRDDLGRHHAAPLRQRHAGRARAPSPARMPNSAGRPAHRRQHASGASGSAGRIDEVRVYDRALTRGARSAPT